MGEEQKKSEELKAEEPKVEEQKSEEPNKTEEKKKEEEAKPAEEEKAQESKPDEAKAEEVAPPLPPPKIVLKVFMHCEGCARKVRRCLKGFPGVEEVITDCKSHQVVVKGEKADPLKVQERIQRKSHRKVEVLSPIPKPPEEKKAQEEEEKPKPKPEEKKVEPQIVTVLKVHMHCEACAQEIKRRMQRMKGVESAEPDLKNSQVSVKGVYDPAKLVEYMYKRTGKQAVIVNQEAEKREKVEEAAKEEKKEEKKEEEKKSGEDGENKEKKEEETKVDAAKEEEKEEATSAEENKKVVPEVKINEYFYNPQRNGMELYAYPAHSAYPAHYQAYPAQYQAYPGYYHAYPPQLFSDENPNACTVM